MKFTLLVLLQLFLSNYAPYPASPGQDTPAPKGYEPFYISQYSRHGSRFFQSPKMAMSVLGPLSKAAVDGNLTGEGQRLLATLRFMDSSTDGRYGCLSPLGTKEQAAIGERIAARYAGVFQNRDSLRCVSSVYPRCMVSMQYWLMPLVTGNPQLKSSFVSDDRSQRWINPANMDNVYATNAPAVTADFDAHFNYDAFLSRFFTSPETVKPLIKDPVMFMRHLWNFLGDAPCMELSGIEATDFLTKEEAATLDHNYNLYLYLNFGDSEKTWSERRRDMCQLTDRIISDAEKAIAPDSRVAMDVRFGHDGCLFSLMTAYGAEKFAVAAKGEAARTAWRADVNMPMASNALLVFYRKPGSPEVLVKLLFNENETAIPALGKGPYYKWNDFKQLLQCAR